MPSIASFICYNNKAPGCSHSSSSKHLWHSKQDRASKASLFADDLFLTITQPIISKTEVTFLDTPLTEQDQILQFHQICQFHFQKQTHYLKYMGINLTSSRSTLYKWSYTCLLD